MSLKHKFIEIKRKFVNTTKIDCLYFEEDVFMETFSDLPIYVVFILMGASFAASFIDSIAGGGGLVMLPALLLSGVPVHYAIGTNKLVAICGTSVALMNFIKSGKVIWRIAFWGLIFSLIGSVVGTKAILFFDERTATKIVMWILPFTAIVTFLPKKQIKSELSEFSKKDIYFISPLIGFVIGFYDGFFGPGAGTFLILAFYAVMGMNIVNASAVAKVINLASGVGAFITFAFAGKVLYGICLPLIAANILGGYVGSKMAIKMGHSFVRIMIIFVFIVMFISLLIKYL